MKIATNRHWRTFLDLEELTPKEQAEFDYFNHAESRGNFIRYHGMTLDAGEFLATNPDNLPENEAGEWAKWDGYYGLHAWAAVVIKINPADQDHYMIGYATF